MPNDELPPPPDNPFEDAPPAATVADKSLADEDDYRKLLIAEIEQRMRVRTIAICTALFMLALLSVYAAIVLWQVAFVDAVRLIPWTGLDRSTTVVLIVTPIISISTIIVMILIGAFRRFKDEDVDKVDFRSLLAEAIKTVPK